eukprot:8982521-Alexandrium_andersonii.AAC.1
MADVASLSGTAGSQYAGAQGGDSDQGGYASSSSEQLSFGPAFGLESSGGAYVSGVPVPSEPRLVCLPC